MSRLRELAERLENHYAFECEGGPLRLCVEWQELKAALVREPEPPQERHPVAALLKRLPDDLACPEVVLEDDGDIALDWQEGRDAGLSLHIGTDGGGGWAALIGEHKSHGRFIVESEWPAELNTALRLLGEYKPSAAALPRNEPEPPSGWRQRFYDAETWLLSVMPSALEQGAYHDAVLALTNLRAEARDTGAVIHNEQFGQKHLKPLPEPPDPVEPKA